MHGGVGEGAGLILEHIDAARLAGARVFGPDLEMKPASWVMDSASGMAAAVRAGPISSVGKLKWICSRLGMVNLSWALNDGARIIGSRHLGCKKAHFRGIVTAK